MKTLGIIGGLGPMATAYFMELVTGMTDVDCDQKHIPIVLQSIPQTPDRTSYILDHIQKNPLPQMVEAGKRLKEAGAAYLAIPCVTAHYFYRELCRQIDLPIISLLEKTADYFRTEGVDEVAILATSGTVMCKIIQQELGKKHIQTLLPDERQQQKIMEIIYKQIKAGRSVEIEEFEQIGTQLQQRGAQKLLLGCTELSLLKRDFTLNQAYADVLEILASAVVTYNGLPVKRVPDKIAFANDKTQLTFQQFSDDIRAIGSELIRKGYQKEPVLIYMNKSPEALEGFFGVIESGCFYVPLDEEMPKRRIELIIENTKARVIICDQENLKRVKELPFDGEIMLHEELAKKREDKEKLDKVRRIQIRFMCFLLPDLQGCQKG